MPIRIDINVFRVEGLSAADARRAAESFRRELEEIVARRGVEVLQHPVPRLRETAASSMPAQSSPEEIGIRAARAMCGVDPRERTP